MNTFRTELDNNILRIRFGDAGARNLMRDEWFSDLDVVLRDAIEDPQVRSLHLSAEGMSFSSGGDLREFLNGPFPNGALDSGLARCLATFETFDKPIVAVVHGAAIGGGATLLLHCDFVYAHPDTMFQLPFTRIGLVPELGSTVLLPATAGTRLSAELMLLGRPFDASTAVRAGLLNEILDSPELEKRADETAATLASLPPVAVRSTKNLLKRSMAPQYALAWRDECRVLEKCFQGQEVKEACTAFFEKRKPDFSRVS